MPCGVGPAGGALLPHRFTLTTPAVAGSVRRFAFCCTGRRLAPPRRYLAPCPMEPGLSSSHCCDATVWPTPPRIVVACSAQIDSSSPARGAVAAERPATASAVGLASQSTPNPMHRARSFDSRTAQQSNGHNERRGCVEATDRGRCGCAEAPELRNNGRDRRKRSQPSSLPYSALRGAPVIAAASLAARAGGSSSRSRANTRRPSASLPSSSSGRPATSTTNSPRC